MDSAHFDIVIVGAGLAGLSLAARLCAPKFAHLQVAIIDPRTTFGATHTWSFFQQGSQGFIDCVAHNRKWQQLWVRARSVETYPHDFSASPYCSVESTQFYKKCLENMARNPSIKTFFGHIVESIVVQDSGGAKLIFTNAATNLQQSLTASLVFDSRPPLANKLGKHAWIQAFAGGEVRCAAPHFAPMLARSEAVLMDFILNPDSSIPTFIYLLPSSPTQALVQATVFVPPGFTIPNDEALQGLVMQYLQTNYAGFEITQQSFEAGRIVMDAAIPTTTALQTITKIGAAGGFVRASTGYSFTRTQRACDALETAIEKAISAREFLAGGGMQNLSVPIFWQSRLVPFLDRIFLEAIATPNYDVGKLMATLFNRVAPWRLVRFLDGNMSFLDALAVIMVCPKWVFIRSFFICVWRFLSALGRGGAR
jgi:lycopene beta-cyclase